jgi:hypothetical protein
VVATDRDDQELVELATPRFTVCGRVPAHLMWTGTPVAEYSRSTL